MSATYWEKGANPRCPNFSLEHQWYPYHSNVERCEYCGGLRYKQ